MSRSNGWAVLALAALLIAVTGKVSLFVSDRVKTSYNLQQKLGCRAVSSELNRSNVVMLSPSYRSFVGEKRPSVKRIIHPC